MNISIIAVGSELLLGQIANTNGQYLSRLFNSVGKNVVEHTVIGDNPKRLEYVVKEGLKRFDMLVLTGGLGPTKDDLTKHTVAKVLNKKLVTDDEALNYIESYFKEQGQEMTPNNKQQALVIESAEVLANHNGMAPGMLIEHGDKKIVMLPGPPREMQPMAKNELLPLIMDDETTILSEQLRFAGIGESKVETVLLDLIDQQSNPTIAPLAGTDEVYIRLTANAETISQCRQLIQPIKDEILSRLEQYYFGSDDVTIEKALLSELNGTCAIYDGVTDGGLYQRLKTVDDKDLVKGMLPASNVFISEELGIEVQLEKAAKYVQDLYNVEYGIAILNKEEEVYLGVIKDKSFKVTSFKMPLTRNIIKRRSQNYAMINLYNWFKED